MTYAFTIFKSNCETCSSLQADKNDAEIKRVGSEEMQDAAHDLNDEADGNLADAEIAYRVSRNDKIQFYAYM